MVEKKLTEKNVESGRREQQLERKSPLWKQAVSQFIDLLKETYGTDFCQAVLFGSRAREDAEEVSDVDILVVLRDYRDYWAELHRVANLAYASTFGSDIPVVISAFPVREGEYYREETPLLLNVRREGVRVG